MAQRECNSRILECNCITVFFLVAVLRFEPLVGLDTDNAARILRHAVSKLLDWPNIVHKFLRSLINLILTNFETCVFVERCSTGCLIKRG